MQSIATDKTAFDRSYDPISSQGVMRFAVDVEQMIDDILNGESTNDEPSFDKLLLTDQTEKTIASGAITAPTLAFHTVKAESGTTDDLDTISASNNTFLFLKAKAGHTIAIRNGTGNIWSSSGVEMSMTGNRVAMLFCQGGQWSLIGMNIPHMNQSATADPGSTADAQAGYSVGSIWINTTLDRAWECVDASSGAAIWKLISPWKNEVLIAPHGAAAGYVQVGIVTSAAGAAATVADADGLWTQHTTAASAGDFVYVELNGRNYFRPAHNPYAEITIKTGSVVTLQRLWIGLGSALPTNVDTLAAGTKFIGWRFSTVAGDAGWIPVLNDGGTQSVGSAQGGTVLASTVYRFKIRVDAALTTAYLSVNDGAEQALSTNFPAIGTDMGTEIELITTTAAARSLLVGPHKVNW